jgi:alkylation response protein AidB-like acyl-CoA dehydrogenase
MSAAMGFDCVVDPEAILFGGDERHEGLRRYNEANQPIYHLALASAYAGHGTPLRNYPIAQRHIGEMTIRLLQAESIVARLAARIDAGDALDELDELAVLMTASKVVAAEAASAIARQAMLAAGGASYVREFLPIERHLRLARGFADGPKRRLLQGAHRPPATWHGAIP